MVQFQTKRKVRHILPDEWPLQVVGRTGMPPLRFASKPLAHVQSGDKLLFIALFERKRGGFVVWHTSFVDGSCGEAAQTCPLLIDAVTYLEDLCTMPSLDRQGTGSSFLQLDFDLLAFEQRFAALVGDTLAIWDDLYGPFEKT